MKYVLRFAMLGVLVVAGPATAATESPHERLQRDCETCHRATSFSDVVFDHGQTGFVLEGRHEALACLSCHTPRDFAEVARGCTGCHLDVHEVQLGVDCGRCHTVQSWDIFDVEAIHIHTQFPIMSRHARVDCQSCHPTLPQGNMSSVTTRCVVCHQVDYVGTTRPSHVSSAFSTECQECHRMDFWRPANMGDHDALFPIFSGRHAGVWSDCTICHSDPANHRNFTCLSCHEHSQPDMDGGHAGMPGYSYVSTACYSCHPTGEAGRFLQHDGQFFPVYSGRHAGTWNDCGECHTDPNNRTAYSCLVCHLQPDMDPVHQGFPGYAYQSTTCFSCHPTGDAGRFVDHDPQFFPIFAGKHAGKWNGCEDCHTVPGQNNLFSCLEGCHHHTQTKSWDQHKEEPGYAYDSNECLSCHPSGRKE